MTRVERTAGRKAKKKYPLTNNDANIEFVIHAGVDDGEFAMRTRGEQRAAALVLSLLFHGFDKNHIEVDRL